MEHIAIDLGSRESQVCVRDAAGKIVEERRVPTARVSKYLGRRPRGRVILETCAEAFCIADSAAAAGHEIRVVPATLVKSLGVGARGIKTDQRDARTLSEVSTRVDLPSVHVPSLQSRDRKALCNSRQTLLVSRTMMTNYVRGHLRRHAITLGPRNPARFVERARDALHGHPLGMPSHIEWILCSVEALNTQIEAADTELAQLAEGDELCKRLMTVPGVGAVVAVRFAAVVDQHERFQSSHDLMSYLGLTPGENSSSQRKRRTGITKAGAADLRGALVQGAWSAMRCKTRDPMACWALRIAERRNKQIAAVALARKIAGILYALWKHGTTYQPNRAALQADEATMHA